MMCCGRECQVIQMRAGELPVDLQRCVACGSRRWVHEGRPVDTEEAFSLLASAFRAAPRAARASRDRSAQAAAARAAARAAAYALEARLEPTSVTPGLAPAEAPRRRREDGVAPRAVVAALPSPRQVDLAELTSALAGWQVLGAQQPAHA